MIKQEVKDGYHMVNVNITVHSGGSIDDVLTGAAKRRAETLAAIEARHSSEYYNPVVIHPADPANKSNF